jgi:SAM-dependent methyltransferase
MTQNIYDTPDFFAGYSQLPRSRHGLDAAPEWPVLRGMLPDLAGEAVLDLGCGFGWFCRWAAENGAAAVLGLDYSENMLARAQAETADPAIYYQRADLETVALPEATYRLVYSSLALHYITDIAGLFAKVRRCLRPGGAFVVSVEHPVVTATVYQEMVTGPDGLRYWPLTDYASEGERVTDWLAKGVIKQHRMVQDVLKEEIAKWHAVSIETKSE